MHICGGVEKTEPDFLQLELQAVARPLLQVGDAGNWIWVHAWAVSTPNHWTISPVLCLFIFVLLINRPSWWTVGSQRNTHIESVHSAWLLWSSFFFLSKRGPDWYHRHDKDRQKNRPRFYLSCCSLHVCRLDWLPLWLGGQHGNIIPCLEVAPVYSSRLWKNL